LPPLFGSDHVIVIDVLVVDDMLMAGADGGYAETPCTILE